MSETGYAYTHLFGKGLPAPTPKFAGFPKYNFIGGHNDPVHIPVEGLIEAAASVLRREGSSLAMYNLGQGPQGGPVRRIRLLRLRALQEIVHRRLPPG